MEFETRSFDGSDFPTCPGTRDRGPAWGAEQKQGRVGQAAAHRPFGGLPWGPRPSAGRSPSGPQHSPSEAQPLTSQPDLGPPRPLPQRGAGSPLLSHTAVEQARGRVSLVACTWVGAGLCHSSQIRVSCQREKNLGDFTQQSGFRASLETWDVLVTWSPCCTTSFCRR